METRDQNSENQTILERRCQSRERERELAFSAIVLRCDILCFLLSTCERRIGWKREEFGWQRTERGVQFSAV
jgi:hypothetical protein